MKNKIAELREEYGISQEKLAKELGISRPYLSGIETGKVSNPGGKIMLKIAKKFKRGVETVFFDESNYV